MSTDERPPDDPKDGQVLASDDRAAKQADDTGVILELAGLFRDPIKYEQRKREAAKRLGVPLKAIDKAVRGVQQTRNPRTFTRIVESPARPLPNSQQFVCEMFGHRDHALLLHQGGAWYRWDGACWPVIEERQLRKFLYDFFEHAGYRPAPDAEGILAELAVAFDPSRRKIDDVVDALRAATHLPVTTQTPSWLGGGQPAPATELVPFANGLVHVASRALHRHTPRFYGHHAVPFEFDADAPQPERWLQFLGELWPNDAQSVETLQELFGYILGGGTKQQKLFLIVGPRRSGKGTIGRVLRAMLGEHNVAGPTLAGLATNFGLSPLIGKPLGIVADARLKSTDTSIVTERLLSISGEDTLTVDRKWAQPWTGTLPTRLIVMTNELPRLADSSGALASRFIMLTMTTSFYGRENTNLTAELCAELPSILNWALDGLQRLQARGHFVQPASSREAIREIEDLGSPVGAFIRDEGHVGAEHSVSCEDLYRLWKTWCEEHGRPAGNAQLFGRDLRAAYPRIRVVQPRNADGSRYRCYEGIGLARDGTRSTPMYSSGTGSLSAHENDAFPVNDNALARVPTRAKCPRCDGEGCDTCGEFKAADGTPL